MNSDELLICILMLNKASYIFYLTISVTTILCANKNCCFNLKLRFYNLITIHPTENSFKGRSV